MASTDQLFAQELDDDGGRLVNEWNGLPSWPNAPSDPRMTGQDLSANWRGCAKYLKQEHLYQRTNNRQRTEDEHLR